MPVAAKDASPIPLKLVKTTEQDVTIRLDGVLDEPIWKTLVSSDGLVVIDPDTLADVPFETRTQFFYTNKGLYIGVWNEQDPDLLITRLTSRDSYIPRDSISVTLDASGEGLYGYWFGIGLGGSLQDGTVLPERQFSPDWDGPWSGASAEHDEGWSAELFIPWSMMTMPETESSTREIGFYISRFVANKNERWGFPALPKTKGVFMSQLQKLQLEGINPKQQFTFYPFASTTYDNAAEANEDSYKAGFDFFWRPTSNLQITATVNPDFGNVESDNVVVNLTSFETFFPEKRAFFLEGQEIFTTSPRARLERNSTAIPTTMVNTRRIGSAPVETGIEGFELEDIEANQPSELQGAAKITGQQGKFRYGILAAFEEDTKLVGRLDESEFETVQDGREFGVARLLYEDQSTGARRSLGWISTLVSHPLADAIVHGIDAHYLSKNGRWNSDLQLMASDVADVKGQGGFVDVNYTPLRGRKHTLSFDYYDSEFDINDFGFLRRNDIKGLRYIYKRDASGLPKLKVRTTEVRVARRENSIGQVVRTGLFFSQKRIFYNDYSLKSDLNFFPQRWDDRNSLGNGSFRIDQRWNGIVFLRSDESRKISLGAGLSYLTEDLGGDNIEYKAELVWRPTDRFSLVAKLKYRDRKGWLLYRSGQDMTTYNAASWRPKIEMDVFLSARQQFRITAQWAGIKASEDERFLIPAVDGSLQRVVTNGTESSRDFTISRLTFQARYRWEIAPLSDLFVVYTRGSNVDSMPGASFENLLHDSWTDALVDTFVIKLRYRMGS
ncbi:MAG: hypothetical protein KUG79_05060 [Pseudomonadales bacterium]|nr:hypothetical protein [Pseudomonadales bacterium]